MKSKFTYLLVLLFTVLVASGLMAQTVVTHTFTTDGSFTVPSGVTSITVQVWGGGGAGGAATYLSATETAGSGGGGGGYVTAVLTGLSGQTFSLDVGAAASGGGANGSLGFESSITVGLTKFITASGGVGGLHNNNDGTPAGGLGGSGSVTSPGGFTIFSNSVLIGQQGGSGSFGTGLTSGAGGNAAYLPGGGGTGALGVTGSTQSGNAGNPYGGGGSGGLAVGSGTGNGGGGSQGLIVITYECSPPSVSVPASYTAPGCQTQATIDAHFSSWLAGFSAVGGVSLTTSRDPVSPTAPNYCGGTVTVTWTVSSVCYNEVFVRTYTVPTHTPIAWVQSPPDDITINAPSYACTEQVNWPFVTFSDLCGTASMSITSLVPITASSPNSSGQFPVGVTTVTYSATDFCGNIISKTFSVTVIDVTAPAITGCPSNITLNAAPGACTAIATWTEPTIYEACPGLAVVASHNSGQSFPVGVSTVTYVATDAAGLQSTCTFTVTVIDNQPPSITCPTSPHLANNDPGYCYATLTFAATVSDNCGVLTPVYSIGATPISFPYQFDVGTTTVTVYVEDVNGLSNTCDFTVVVTDNEDPDVTLTPITRSLIGSGYALTDSDVAAIISATDNCGVATPTLSSISPNTFNCLNLGENIVTVTVLDIHANDVVKTVSVTIVDGTDPVITCIGAQSFNAPTGTCSYTFTGAAHWGIDTEDDNCSIVTYTYSLSGVSSGTGSSITGQVFNVGVTTVTWTVYDQSNNSASCSFAVTVNDTQKPTFTCPTPAASYPADNGECYAELNFTVTDAADNCGVASVEYRVGGSIITYPYNFLVGTTSVTVTVTDVNGLTATCTFDVVVVDTQDPVISCTAINPTTVTADEGTCNDYVVIVLPVATDNCAIGTYTLTASVPMSVYQNPSESNRWEAAGTFPLGATTVTLTVTDVNGRSSSCSFVVQVNYDPIISQEPIAKTQNIIRVLDTDGEASITPPDVYDVTGSSIFASCAFESWSVFPNAFDCDDIGVNTVTLTVNLKDGSSYTGTATVTIQDIQVPVVTPKNITVNLVTSTVTIDADDLITDIDDNCDIVTTTLSRYTFDCNDVGTTVIVTISATDQGNNTGTATAVVTVTDTTPPVVVTQNIEVNLDALTGTVSITPDQIHLSSSDNCGVDSMTMTLDIDDFDCDDVGTPVEVTLTVNDVNGNPATATATVTVKDVTPPVVDCATNTFDRNNTPGICFYTVVGAEFDKSAVDVCDDVLTVTNTFNGNATLAGANIPVGTNTITWYFTDDSGNTATCVIIVTVTDNEPPVFTSFPTGVDRSIGNACIDLYTWNRPVFADNCTIDPSSLSFSYVTNNTVYNNGIINFTDLGTSVSANFPAGTTTITYTAKDIYGLTVTQTFTVKQTETAKPIVKTKPHTVVLDAAGNGSITAADINSPYHETTNPDGTRDLCSDIFISIVSNTFTCTNLGANYVVLTVTDLSGNVQVGVATVTVVDQTDPTLVCVTGSPLTRFADIGTCTYTVSGTEFDPTTVFDVCGVATLTYELTGATIAGPVVSSTLNGVIFGKGQTTVTWRAVDASFNDTECSFVVDVVDTQTPTISCAGPFEKKTDPDVCEYEVNGNEFDPIFGDNCSGATVTNTFNNLATLAGAKFQKGTTLVTWTVTDAAGLQASCQVSITIVDEELPQIGCVTDTFKPSASNQCGYVVSGAEFNPVVSDNCTLTGALVVTNTFTNTSSLSGALIPVGTTTITWYVADESGNTNSCTFSVTVTDVTNPWFTSFPSGYNIPLGPGTCSEARPWEIPVAADNCGTPTLSYTWESSNPGVTTFSPTTIITYYVGVYTITWTATDVNNLSHSQSFVVRVIDQTPPQVLTKPHTVYLLANGIGTMTPDNINSPYHPSSNPLGTYDQCGPVTLGLSTNTFTCSNLGANLVTLYVTDLSGNTSSQTTTVTVVDQIKPEIVCVSSPTLTVSTDAGVCNYLVKNDEFDPTFVDDNCTVATQTYTLSGATTAGPVVATSLVGVTFSKGTTTVVWTAIDQSNNTATCTFDVLVADQEPPAIACISSQDRGTDDNVCTYTAQGTEFDPTSFGDNCPNAVVSYDLSGITSATGVVTNTLNGVVFNKGVTNVTWYIEDEAGNIASCTFAVTVTDDEKPELLCLGANPDPVGSATNVCTYTHSGIAWDATATDNCDLVTPTYTLSGATTIVTAPNTTLDGQVFNLGVTTVTWYVADEKGNFDECSFVVTVEDITKPWFTSFPTSVSRTLASGACSIGVNWAIPTAADNCGVGNVTFTWETNNTSVSDIYPDEYTPGRYEATFYAGVTTITYTVYDVNGLSHSQSFSVTVKDVNVPVVLTKSHTVVLNASGVGTMSPEDITVVGVFPAGTSDQCGPVTLGLSTNTFSCSNLGANTVTLYVTDLSGNTASATAIVTVVDQTKPEIVCVVTPTLTVSTNSACTYVHSGNDWDATATDNCTVTTQTYTLSGETTAGPVLAATLNGVTFNKGTTTVLWTAIDQSGNTSTCTFTVIVEDQVYPTLSCVGNQNRGTDDNLCTYTADGAEFDAINPTDNCPNAVVSYDLSGETSATGVVTNTLNGVAFNKGLTTVTWYIRDEAGNTTSCSFTVTVTDDEKPDLVCLGTNPEAVGVATNVCSYTHSGLAWDATATDNCDLVLTPTYTLSGATTAITAPNTTLNGQIFELGVTTVTWYVADEKGNFDECSFVVTVIDNQPPILACGWTPNQVFTLDVLTDNCLREVAWTVPDVTEHCGNYTLTLTVSDPTVLPANWEQNSAWVTSGTIVDANFPIGITTVTYTATDAVGNSTSCSFIVKIVDPIPPIARVVAPFSVTLDANGEAFITVNMVNPQAPVLGSTDNCAIETMTLSVSEFTCDDLGVLVGARPVTLTVYDKGGLSHSATTYVTVLDNIPPVAVTQNIDVYLNDLGTVTITTAMVDFDSDDNCGIVTYTLDIDQFWCANVGQNTVTLTVYDASGNTHSATSTVTVYDNIEPTVACVSDQNKFTDPGQCTYTVNGTEFNPTNVWDNCSNYVLSYALNGETTGNAVTNTLAGVQFAKGVTVVEWTVKDASNHIGTCSFTVTVTDNQNPTIGFVTDTFTKTALGVSTCTYTAVGNEFDPTSYDDNCPGEVITHDYTGYAPSANTLAGAIFPIGHHTITWTVTDASTNSATYTIYIHVKDETAPVWNYNWHLTDVSKNCGGEIILYGCSEEFNWRRPNLSDLSDCSDVVITETISNSVVQGNVDTSYGEYDQNETNPVHFLPEANLTPGVYTFTYTATDAHNNTSSCYFVVRVVQFNAPLITSCPAPRSIVGCTVSDISGPAFSDTRALSGLAEFLSNGGIYNKECNDPSIAEVAYIDVVVSTVACPITVERTWYLTDFIGRTVSCTQTITVTENEAPTLIVAGSLPGGDVGNVCIANVPVAPTAAYIAALYEDNCPSATVTATFDVNSGTPVGNDCGWTVTYTFSVKDNCLNETIAHVVYTGADNEAPGLVSSAITTNSLDLANQNICLDAAQAFDATTLQAAVAALYVDNCNTVTATLTDTDVTGNDCAWIITYTYTIADECGKSVTSTVVYSGGDTEAPVLTGTIPGEDVGSVCISARPAAPSTAEIAALYTDNCGVVTSTLINTELDGSNCGWTVTYTYSVEDECGKRAADAVVVYTGADVTPPVVSNNPAFALTYTCSTLVPGPSESHITWTDNCSSVAAVTWTGSIVTQMGCSQTYIVTRTYTVTDQCNNTTIFKQQITVRDDVPPSLTGTAYAGLTNVDACLAGAVVAAPFVAADAISGYTDNCGPVTATLETTAVGGTDCAWTVTHTFTVSDECGNPLTGQTYVNRGGDKTPPALTTAPYAGPTDVNACYANAETAAPFSAANAIIGYADLCGGTVTATLTNTDKSGTDCAWTVTYTYTVYDACDNPLSGRSYTVSGGDKTPPALTGDPYVLTGVNACLPELSAAAAMFEPAKAIMGYTDLCGQTVTATLTHTAVDGTDCAWIVTYTYTVYDACNNPLPDQTYTVTGSDQTAPSLSANPGNQIVNVTTGQCYYVIPGTATFTWDVTADDNCGPVTPSYTLTGATEGSGSSLAAVQFEPGLTTVVWSVTDGCGNPASLTFTVQVNDTPPVWNPANPEICGTVTSVYVDDLTSCTYTHGDNTWNLAATVNCGVATVTYELFGATQGTGTTLNGQVFNCGTTTVTWTAIDASGNSISCTFTVVVKPTELRGNISYLKSPIVTSNTPLEGIVVNLIDASGGIVGTTSTTANGNYLFTDQAALLNTVAIEVSTTKPNGGLSANDAYIIQRASVGNPLVAFWTPPTFLNYVGDVYYGFGFGNFDQGVLSIIDSYFAQYRAIFTESPFESGDWAFYAPLQNTIFSNTNDKTARIPYAGTICKLDIVARAFGDVDGTYPIMGLKASTNIQTEKYIQVEVGEEFVLPLFVRNNIEFNSMTLELIYNSSKIDVLDIKSELSEFVFKIEDGIIRVAWSDLLTLSMNEGDPLVNIVMRTRENVLPTDVIIRQGGGTEFSNNMGLFIPDFRLGINSISNVEDDIAINDVPDISLSAIPNPFKEEVKILYSLPNDADVRITIVNNLGAEIFEVVNRRHEAGVYSHSVTELSGSIHPGVYYVRMQVSNSLNPTVKAVKLIHMR